MWVACVDRDVPLVPSRISIGDHGSASSLGQSCRPRWCERWRTPGESGAAVSTTLRSAGGTREGFCESIGLADCDTTEGVPTLIESNPNTVRCGHVLVMSVNRARHLRVRGSESRGAEGVRFTVPTERHGTSDRGSFWSRLLQPHPKRVRCGGSAYGAERLLGCIRRLSREAGER